MLMERLRLLSNSAPRFSLLSINSSLPPGQLSNNNLEQSSLKNALMKADTTTPLPFYGPLSGTTRVSRNNHPLKPILNINHLLSASSIYYDPEHPPCSIYVSDSLSASVQVLFGLAPPLHTPCISSPNDSLPFATHAYNNATCFAVVPRLCHITIIVKTKTNIS